MLSATALQLICDFCSISGHSQRDCHCYKRMKEQAAKEAQEKKKDRKKNKANTASTTPDTSNSASVAFAAQEVTEFAGQASVRLSSHSTPAELASHLLWTADTGSTSHMTLTNTGFATTLL